MFANPRSILAGATLVLVNTLLLYRVADHARRLALTREKPLEQYTFVDEDIPSHLPLPSARPSVLLSVEESERYLISAPEAELEWWSTSVGDGNVHLGPSERLFSVSLAHELHCLRTIRRALDDDDVPKGAILSHIVHCFNFLREHTICAADCTLEPADAFQKPVSARKIGLERRCADWTAVNDAIREDVADFSEM